MVTTWDCLNRLLIRGYSLALLEILEKVSKLSGKPVGWFYFGEIENYIKEYLLIRGQKVLLENHPDVPLRIKEQFLTSEYKNRGWEIDFGYSDEGFIDDCYAEIHYLLLREHIQELALDYLEKHTKLNEKEKEEVCVVITSEMMSTYEMFGNFVYEDTDIIIESIQHFYENKLKKEDVAFL